MIPPSKYDIVNRWAAEKVMGWTAGKYLAEYEPEDHAILTWILDDDYPYCPKLMAWQDEWTPCTDLNDCKKVVDRLISSNKNPRSHGIADSWAWECSRELSQTDDKASWFVNSINAPADIRMEAVLRVYFPDMTTEQAIEEIEKECV